MCVTILHVSLVVICLLTISILALKPVMADRFFFRNALPGKGAARESNTARESNRGPNPDYAGDSSAGHWHENPDRSWKWVDHKEHKSLHPVHGSRRGYGPEQLKRREKRVREQLDRQYAETHTQMQAQMQQMMQNQLVQNAHLQYLTSVIGQTPAMVYAVPMAPPGAGASSSSGHAWPQQVTSQQPPVRATTVVEVTRASSESSSSSSSSKSQVQGKGKTKGKGKGKTRDSSSSSSSESTSKPAKGKGKAKDAVQPAAVLQQPPAVQPQTEKPSSSCSSDGSSSPEWPTAAESGAKAAQPKKKMHRVKKIVRVRKRREES